MIQLFTHLYDYLSVNRFKSKSTSKALDLICFVTLSDEHETSFALSHSSYLYSEFVITFFEVMSFVLQIILYIYIKESEV